MDTHKMIRMEYCSSALHLQKSCSNHGQTHRGNAIVERCSAKHFRRVPPVDRCPISHETLLDPADWQLTLVLSKITRLLDFLNITFGDSYRELTEVSGLGCSILWYGGHLRPYLWVTCDPTPLKPKTGSLATLPLFTAPATQNYTWSLATLLLAKTLPGHLRPYLHR